MAAHVRHGIDRGGAANYLAARALDRTAADARLRLGEVAPVVQAMREQAPPCERDAQPRIAIPAACLKYEHAHIRILGQAMSEHAARRSRADDHIVVIRGQGRNCFANYFKYVVLSTKSRRR